MSNFLDTFAELNAAFGQEEGALTLPLERLYEDPQQPRERFDEAELDHLAETVRRRGVLQPIVVRPADPDGRYMIRFGARRFRAAQRAGLAEIKAFVRGGEAKDVDVLIEQVLENEQRAGLTTAERARTVARLLALGLRQAEISRELRWPKDVVAMLAAVPSMAPPLQALAQTLGARTLYELHGAWQADPESVERWLKDRDPDHITQAAARALAARTGARQRPARGAVPQRDLQPQSAAAPTPAAEAGEAPGGPAAVLVEVRCADRLGVLALDRPPPGPGEAWVRFGRRRAPERVAIAELSLVGVRAVGAGAEAP